MQFLHTTSDVLTCKIFWFVAVRSFTADSSLLQPTVCVNTTPHTSHFLIDLHAHAWLKSCVCRAHIMCHESSPCAHVFVPTLFDYFHFPLSADHLLSYHPVLPPAHQLHLPRCGGQIPCALSLMRTLAPLPSTTLSQVMSPTTTTSRRLLNDTSRNPRSSSGPRMTSSTMTSLSARRSLMRAVDEPITLKTKLCRPVSRRPLVMIERGRPVVKPFDSQIPNVRENPSHSSESEQTRILLERQREQILADCQAEIRKHEFQADYDRRRIQKLNEMIESQRGEICRAHQGDERLRRDQQLLHEQLLEQAVAILAQEPFPVRTCTVFFPFTSDSGFALSKC